MSVSYRYVPNTPAGGWSLLDRSSRYDDDDDDEEVTLKYPTASALSLVGGAACSQEDDDRWFAADGDSVDGALGRGTDVTPEVFPATPALTIPRTSPPGKQPSSAGEAQQQVRLRFSLPYLTD